MLTRSTRAGAAATKGVADGDDDVAGDGGVDAGDDL